MNLRRLGIAALALGLLAGTAGGAAAQDLDDPTDYESWRTKEVEPGVLRILDDGAGHELAQKWPKNHRGFNHIAVGPDNDVWISVAVVNADGERTNESRLWRLGQTRAYGRVDGVGRHHNSLAFDDDGRLWLFGNRVATFEGGEWSSTKASNSVVAPDGSVWLTGNGLGVEQWDGTDLIRHLEGIWTGAVFVGPDGTIGADSWDGQRLFDGSDWGLLSSRNPVRAVVPNRALAVLLGDRKGVRLYGDDQTTTVLEGSRVNSISAAPDGSIWVVGSVGRNRGAVYRIDPSEVFAAQAVEDAAATEEAEADETEE